MLMRDLGIIPAQRGGDTGDRSSPYVNLSRRAFVGGAGLFVLGVTLAGCSTYVEPEIDADAFDLPDAGPQPADRSERRGCDPGAVDRDRQGRCRQDYLPPVRRWASRSGRRWRKSSPTSWKPIGTGSKSCRPKGMNDMATRNTDGSRSVRFNFHRLRVAGAAMRQMLVAAAALHWKLPQDQCSAKGGLVSNSQNGETLSYGNLAELAGRLAIPAEADITLKTPREWRYINAEIPSLTVPRIVKGEGTFGIDVTRPGMVHAVIARPPQLFGRVGSVDDAKALEVPGVLGTVRLPDAKPPALFQPLGGVAVVARDTWAAIEGRRALDIAWADGPNAGYDSETYAAQMQATARRSGKVRRSRGNVAAALAAADKRVSAEYYAPHLGQTPMEPPSATAEWDGDRLECWACVQDPQSTRDTLAGALGIDKELIKVTPTWLGGAFGRKSKPDFVIEAALIAREVGKPVKVTWTREDDIRHGYYHSVSAQYCEGGLDKDGTCTAWLHRTVFPPISSTFDNSVAEPSDGELGMGASDVPFAAPNLRVESGNAKGHVRIGWLRSVANIYHAFAVQSFAAELAHAAGRDQKDYLLELIGPPRMIDPEAEGAKYGNYGASLEEYPIDTGRLRQVAEKAAGMAKWGRKLPDGHGLGIAVHRSFLS